MADSVWVPVTIKETTAGMNGAVLIEDEEGVDHWIPRSQILDHTTDTFDELNDESHGKDCELEISEWFATKDGLA